jgi:hypothetical protein
VTEVKNFDDVFIFLDPVVDKNGAMLQFSDAGPFSDYTTHAGEPAKQIHVVEQCTPKTAGGLAIVLGNVPDDFSEVA